MRLLEQLRYHAFWLFDSLKGGPVKKHYDEIRFLNENYFNPKAVALREQHLSNLLKHAVESVPFYQKFDHTEGLTAFPVVNKVQIKENYQAFETTNPKYRKEHKTATSGSTGIPFKLYQDKTKRIRNIADTIYFADKSGIQIGKKVYFMRAWNEYNRKKPLQAWLQNVKMQDISNFTDEAIKEFLDELSKDRHEKGIWGYASSLDLFANYFDHNEYDTTNINLASIVATSEHLSAKTKKVLEEQLNTKVISRYSNAENGMFAIQEPGGNTDFMINWASYFFEILKLDSDEPAEMGEPGRIIITDLFNYNTPIIRYDIGDVGVIEFNQDKVPVFTKIEGRKQDIIYNTKGEMISSYVISRLMVPYHEILQFQFVQESRTEYTMKLNAKGDFPRAKELIDEIQPYFGDDAIVKIEYIDEIPLLASGKRQRVVNNYKKVDVPVNH